MFKNKMYFCFGDYRSGKKEYRIFTVDSVEKAHAAAEEIGYKVVTDETVKFEGIADLEERIAQAILSSVHRELHGVENTVSCIRKHREATKALKRHFMKTDMKEYFPKILPEPVVPHPSNPKLNTTKRKHPWVIPYIRQEMEEAFQGVLPKRMPVREIDPNQRSVFKLDEPIE